MTDFLIRLRYDTQFLSTRSSSATQQLETSMLLFRTTPGLVQLSYAAAALRLFEKKVN
jgi:hypothetical protein